MRNALSPLTSLAVPASVGSSWSGTVTVADNNDTVNADVTVSGNTILTIPNGKTLNVNGTIIVETNKTLTVAGGNGGDGVSGVAGNDEATAAW